jgi:hypothetical protein
MANPIYKFKKWLGDLFETIDKNIPDPDKYDKIWKTAFEKFGEEPQQYLGSGDNGIAFVTKADKVVKFTIDRNEAILWNRIKNNEIPGIARVDEILRLSSSLKGDTYIYIIKVEYVAKDLSNKQSQLVRSALLEANNSVRSYHTKMDHINDRAVRLVNAFEKIAEIDSTFSDIPNLIMDMADKHGGFIYDLKPDNFKVNNNNKAVLIDPSVPDLIGDIKNPDVMMYENVVLKLDTIEILI